MARPLRRAAGARMKLAVTVAVGLLCGGAEARSAAVRASSSASGNNAAQGPPELASTSLAAPLPAPLLAIQDTVFASSAAALAGTSVVCGDIQILQNGNTRPSDLGDGFSRLLKGATDSIAAVLAAPPGTAVSVPVEDMDGANVFLMEYLKLHGGLNVSYAVGKVPYAVAQQGQLAALLYAFDQWGWDCVVSNVIQTPDKMLGMDFFMPTQHYTLGVVAARASVPPISIAVTLGAWAQPFDKPIWAMLASLLIFSAMLMYAFERAAHSHDDFGPEYIHWSDRVGRGLYRATSNWTAIGAFTPVTPAGRVYGMTFAFVMLLMQSAYTANLAAFFTRQAVPTQRVASVDAFATLGLPACVHEDPLHHGWLAANYANTARTTVNGTAADVLQAVSSGLCIGGVAPDAALSFALGSVGDPTGAYCDLEIVQTGLGVNVYAVPLRRGAPWATQAAVRAINALLGVALAYGEYGVEADNQFFNLRPLCTNAAALRESASAALDALKPLGTKQLAGVFFVQAMGLGASVLIFVLSNTASLREAWNSLRGVPPGGFPDPDAEPVDDAEDGKKGGGEHAGELAAAGPLTAMHRQKQISLSAMLSIERSLESAMKQFTHIAQTQRELDVAFLLQEGAQAPPTPASLAVVAKMDRALAFGLRAVGEIVLYDEAGDELAALSYGLPTSEALKAAHSHMSPEAAGVLEAVLVAFLKRRVAARRNAAGRASSVVSGSSSRGDDRDVRRGHSGRPTRAVSSSGGVDERVRAAAAKSKSKPAKGGGGKIPAFPR